VLTVDPLTGQSGALWLIVGRLFQGVGAAFLIANSAAILTDAFPSNQRGLALGINNMAGISGAFIGLILGGVLGAIDWRLVFLVSVPFGLFGTIWSYINLKELGERHRARIDWAGNLTFAVGLILVMIGITYGIEPSGGKTMGWTSLPVLLELGVGVASMMAFLVIESRVDEPMFRLPLFKIKAFTFGTLATFLAGIGRGGLMFMLIIWLQGIWLPLHGYSFARTPLWAGILMLPLTLGFLIAGPLSGYLSDQFGARYLATGGMIGSSRPSCWPLESRWEPSPRRTGPRS
jgi:MFS family permease